MKPVLHLQRLLPYLPSVRELEAVGDTMEYWSAGVMERRKKTSQLKIFYNTPTLQHSNIPRTIV
jgi:uncharacterized protein YqiB (DUF1249 family)